MQENGLYEILYNRVTFMAAPLMWFGLGFDKVLRLKDLGKFKYARQEDLEKGPVYIGLFKLVITLLYLKTG